MKPALLAVAALMLPAGMASAQPPQSPGHGRDAAERMRRQQDEARDLSTVLGLKPAQQPGLQAWLSAMRPPEGMWDHDPQEPSQPPRTTPEMLQEKQARMTRMQQFEAGKLAATKRFYASLDGHQQQVFDALGRLRHEEHGHHHDWHGHRGDRAGSPGLPPVR